MCLHNPNTAIVIASLGSAAHLGHTSHPLYSTVDDYSRARYVRTVAQQQTPNPVEPLGGGDPLLNSLLTVVSFFCKRNSSTRLRRSTSYINFHFHARSTSAAMGYLLVISNDDDDDDDECELCVYPQLKDVLAAGQPNSIHDLECVTKRRVQRTPSARS